MIIKLFNKIRIFTIIPKKVIRKMIYIFRRSSRTFFRYVRLILKKMGLIKNSVFEISTSDLFYLQNFTPHYNDIFDTVVRYLAIENYYKKNNFGFDLYNKMQLKRVNQNWELRFRDLIQSFEKGYNKKHPILLRNNYNISDGSHRLALALYHNIQYVYVEIDKQKKGKRSFSLDWFYEKNFTIDEIKIIKNKYQTLLNKIQYDFIAILWPPAEIFFGDIMKDISSLEGISIRKYSDYKLIDNYNLIRAIYKTDDISSENIEKKIKYMTNSSIGTNQLIRILYLDIEDPQHKIKTKTKQPQSLATMKIKKIIRSRYMDKINNYFYNVIIHISDNFYQSEVSSYLINMPRDIVFLFDHLRKENYVLIKFENRENSKMDFKLKSDYDILVNYEDLDRLSKKISNLMRFRFSDSKFQYREIRNEKEYQFRVELKGFLIIQIHLQSDFFILKKKAFHL